MKQYHVFYTSHGKEHAREEFANSRLTALSQAKNHFSLFGSGDESDFEVFEV